MPAGDVELIETYKSIINITSGSVDYIIFRVHCVQLFRGLEPVDRDEFRDDIANTDCVIMMLGPGLVLQIDTTPMFGWRCKIYEMIPVAVVDLTND